MRVLIVGAGLAGARCAETLRAEGFDGPITLVGEEPVGPYERPALSKELLAGSRDADSLQLRPAESWAERGVQLLTRNRVVRAFQGEALTASGVALPWDALVVATGAKALSLGPGRPRLRTLGDALRLCAVARSGLPLTVVGSGLVGSEVAATLAASVPVTLVGGPPLERILGPEVGALLAERHRAHGVRFLPWGTRTANDILDAVGVRPATEWLRGAVPLRPDGSVSQTPAGVPRSRGSLPAATSPAPATGRRPPARARQRPVRSSASSGLTRACRTSGRTSSGYGCSTSATPEGRPRWNSTASSTRYACATSTGPAGSSPRCSSTARTRSARFAVSWQPRRWPTPPSLNTLILNPDPDPDPEPEPPL